LESIDVDTLQSQGYAFQVELAYRVMKQGFKITEIPITFMDRRVGTSKMSQKIVVEAFTFVLRARFGMVPMPSPALRKQSSRVEQVSSVVRN
jgi:dolichol-phosphate mannosyltransferase